MSEFDNLKISLSFDDNYLLFFFLLIIAVYIIYISFKFTVPPLSSKKKMILIVLRILTLISLLFAALNPKIIISKSFLRSPKILFFIDNSKSIKLKNFDYNKDIIESLFNIANNSNYKSNFEFYVFSDSVKKFNSDYVDLQFDGVFTNMHNIFSFAHNYHDEIGAILIASDGIVNQGLDPIISAKKFEKPILTLQLGDPVEKPDVLIQKIVKPDNFNVNDTIQFFLTIKNTKLAGKTASINFFVDNKIIEKQDIILSSSNLDLITFKYSFTTRGEKKISFSIVPLKEEENHSNNVQTFFVKVEDKKKKIILLSSSLSADYKFIKQALKKNKNFNIIDIAQISANEFLYQDKNLKFIESANVFFMINFPTKNTPQNIVLKVFDKILNQKIPFFILLSELNDFNKLKTIDKALPFDISSSKYFANSQLAQPYIVKDFDPFLIGSFATKNDWNSLPPVYATILDLKLKNSAEIHSYLKIKEQVIEYPLIISSTNLDSKQFAINAVEIWRWKLFYGSEINNELFDNFILSIAEWLLTTEDDMLFAIDLNKKILNLGEMLHITAKAKDEFGKPAQNAQINISIKHNNYKDEFQLKELTAGIYEGFYYPRQIGDYLFEAKYSLNNKTLSGYKTKFYIDEAEIEKNNLVADTVLMKKLSNKNGIYSQTKEDLYKAISFIENIVKNKRIEKRTKSEFVYWNSFYILFLPIFLLTIEWFLRKKNGML